MVVKEWLEGGRVLGPEEGSERESILQMGGGGVGTLGFGFGKLKSKSGEYTGTCEFGTYGDVKELVRWKGYHRYEFETEGYFMGIVHRGGNFVMRIALKEEQPHGKRKASTDAAGTSSSTRANDPLEAWFDAVSHAYHFDSALKDGLESHYENEMPLLGYTSEEQKGTVFAALAAAGWDLETNALETRSPVRVRVGDGKKGM